VNFKALVVLLCFICFESTAADNKSEKFAPGIELPLAEGRNLILRACTTCHTLEGVPAYQKYWGFNRWLPMVENMIEHGAKLDDEEKIVVTCYLAKYFGTEG